ncbi:DUF402 domain-containing protein [Haploplasma axanthum]|nr:DUF402 domain-containing protein [Haploplasma axanthum]
MELIKEMSVSIQSYKHDQKIHRVWKNTKVIDKNEHMLVTAHNKAKVIEENGRTWYTKEPAICYFYDNAWFNVIVMFKKDGIYYYCNLSSPYLYDGEAIKYIDYDLDVKVYPDGTYKVLDENEYNYHLKKMHYPMDVKSIIENELKVLIDKIIKKEAPFNNEYVMNHYNIAFFDQLKEKKV